MSDREALEELLKLSNHYAELLNQYDGGKRMTFATADDWIARLEELEYNANWNEAEERAESLDRAERR